jgi:branched-chain amino acid transport system substrate-binding protein
LACRLANGLARPPPRQEDSHEAHSSFHHFGARRRGVCKIGELSSYKAFPAFTDPYKKGWQIAVDEINANGGIDGKKLGVVSRDDGANPGEAVRVADELVSRQGVTVLAGTFLSNVGPAVANFAGQKKVFFLASELLTDKLTWSEGNRYTFRLRPSTYMQMAMVMPDTVAAHKQRWALVYPNFEYGQAASETFKASPAQVIERLQKRRSSRRGRGRCDSACRRARLARA